MMELPSIHADQRKGDMKIVNLFDFNPTPDHISLLQKGMSFSPVAGMDEFTVYKDITLFLGKVFLQSLHERKDNQEAATMIVDVEYQRALDILNSLLKENEGPPKILSSVRKDIKIKCTRYPACLGQNLHTQSI